MSGNLRDRGSSRDPISSKPLTLSPTPVHPAQIVQWETNSNVPQAPWGLESDSDSEMETQPQTTHKARSPSPLMQVPTASCALTNPLDRSQASSLTPAPISTIAWRVGKKNRPSHLLSTNVSATVARATLLRVHYYPFILELQEINSGAEY